MYNMPQNIRNMDLFVAGSHETLILRTHLTNQVVQPRLSIRYTIISARPLVYLQENTKQNHVFKNSIEVSITVGHTSLDSGII